MADVGQSSEAKFNEAYKRVLALANARPEVTGDWVGFLIEKRGDAEFQGKLADLHDALRGNDEAFARGLLRLGFPTAPDLLRGEPVNMGEVFEALLKGQGIDRPDRRALDRVHMYYTLQYQDAARRRDGDMARTIYDMAQTMLGSTTRVDAAKEGLSINGFWHQDTPRICTAIKSGELKIVKLLPMHEASLKRARDSELLAISELELQSGHAPQVGLVPCEVVEIQVHVQDAAVAELAPGMPHTALVMPWYRASLRHLPQMEEVTLLAGGLCIQEALEYMHGRGLVHLDIKPANIFVGETASDWVLGDYGSCQKKDERVHSSTPGMHPDGSIMRTAAQPKYDWAMLLVTMAIELRKTEPLSALCKDAKSGQVSSEKVLERCATASNEDLHKFLNELAQLSQLQQS